MGNIVIQWTTKFWAHRYRWVFVGIALFTAIYIPVVPYRLECYDGNFRQVNGAPNYQFRKELLIWFQNYQVDYTLIMGFWTPPTDENRAIRKVEAEYLSTDGAIWVTSP